MSATYSEMADEQADQLKHEREQEAADAWCECVDVIHTLQEQEANRCAGCWGALR